MPHYRRSQLLIFGAAESGEEHEQNIWTDRGKLFQFHLDKGTWSERGVGPVRLNVAKTSLDEEGVPSADHGAIQARLLMRTIATHKVVLNAPVFKEWVVGGDARGLEPTGKTLMFSANVDDKMVPHLLRVSSSTPSIMLLKLTWSYRWERRTTSRCSGRRSETCSPKCKDAFTLRVSNAWIRS